MYNIFVVKNFIMTLIEFKPKEHREAIQKWLEDPELRDWIIAEHKHGLNGYNAEFMLWQLYDQFIYGEGSHTIAFTANDCTIGIYPDTFVIYFLSPEIKKSFKTLAALGYPLSPMNELAIVWKKTLFDFCPKLKTINIK